MTFITHYLIYSECYIKSAISHIYFLLFYDASGIEIPYACSLEHRHFLQDESLGTSPNADVSKNTLGHAR